jgi:hypothetical protein
MTVRDGATKPRNGVREYGNFACSSKAMSIFKMLRENKSISFIQKLCSLRSSRLMQRGVRGVTNAEAGCDGRDRLCMTSATDTDGEVAWSWSPGAETKFAVL